DTGSFIVRPLNGFQERLGIVLLPVGKEQFGVGRHAMDDLAAQDAVLAVPGFQPRILAEGARGNCRRQCRAEETSVATKTGVKDRDLHAAAARPGFVPLIHAQNRQVASPLGGKPTVGLAWAGGAGRIESGGAEQTDKVSTATNPCAARTPTARPA